MSKLYIFGIGGTGSRVLRSLTMLLSSGVECGVDEIVPIVIDRDASNGDLSKTHELIKEYIEVNKFANTKGANKFFKTKISLLNNNLCLSLNDSTDKFSDFIGASTMGSNNKALVDILFSEETLNLDMTAGFQGNPNIGSVVLNQFDDNDVFKAFATDFKEGDKIFIISSIFGGTGASGFPLLRKVLQTPNVTDASGHTLPNWGLVNKANIGAISVLPYFMVAPNNDSLVDSDTFIDKARAALSYYKTEDKKLDTLYYIADKNTTTYNHHKGGSEQGNNAHFVELSAAMSILDFVSQEKKEQNIHRGANNSIERTTYKEFGINSDAQNIDFNDLSDETKSLIINPLSRFLLFRNYMTYVFDKERKYQPYANIKRFGADIKESLSKLISVQNKYHAWLEEMKDQNRKFAPFNTDSAKAFDFVHGNMNLRTSEGKFKDWARFDNELNNIVGVIDKSYSREAAFVELFYEVTDRLIDYTNQGGVQEQRDSNYVLRLQSDAGGHQHDLRNTISHWGVSQMFNDKQINAVKSTNKESLKQPTSIPSPFARIALVRTAFAEVAEYGDDALASYKKIVSDTLDVAEIFFKLDKWCNDVEIITWNKEEDLNQLKQGHMQLHKTLRTFLESDADVYNFDRMQNIYLLKHKKTGKIIGATSPCTLFFSSANDLGDVNIQLSNERRAFDKIIPLSERTWDFQKYLYAWIYKNNENVNIPDRAARSLFFELAQYLNQQKAKIGKIAEIDSICSNSEQYLSEYSELRSPDVEVLGKRIHQSKVVDVSTITADDVLESRIIRLPYKIAKKNFFDGNLPDNSKYTYLLPIKDEFFKHYSIADLKKSIKINHAGDVAEVSLKIGRNTINKKYKSDSMTAIEDFNCAIFPNVRFANDSDAHYRLGLVYNFKESEKFKASYMKVGGTQIDAKHLRTSIRNESHTTAFQLKNYSLEGANFDYIKISYENTCGIVVPTMPEQRRGEQYTFAVDFGTTNTHIEYQVDSGNIKSFDIPVAEKQVAALHYESDLLTNVFDEEFIHAYTDEEFKLPMRTALSYGENTQWTNVYPFEKVGLDELYEKRMGYRYNKTKTDLKWSDDADNQRHIRVYIESIMFLLRNKVVIGKGNLQKTKIRWFYPVSMEKSRYDNLKRVWNESYQKYFGGDNKNIVSITESVAPFEYYIKEGDADKLVTIDIGGGTTDMVISSNKSVDYITSFRFAANSIFGDGFSEIKKGNNGIVKQFGAEIKSELQSVMKPNDSIFSIFDDMMKNRSSADIASFLFSIKQNKGVIKAGTNLADTSNLGAKLVADTTQKITFIFFYSSLIYHLAKILKAKRVDMPDKIVFSGNGSRVIPFFTDDADVLGKFTKLIFKKVLGQEGRLEVILNSENPKEATCKGGFFVDSDTEYSETLQKVIVLHSDGSDFVIHRNTELEDKDAYEAINEDYLRKTVEEVKIFINFVFDDLLPFFNNEGYRLNSTSIKIAKEVCFNRLDIYMNSGWKQKQKEIDTKDRIEETLFFYPIVGMMKELTGAICKAQASSKTQNS